MDSGLSNLQRDFRKKIQKQLEAISCPRVQERDSRFMGVSLQVSADKRVHSFNIQHKVGASDNVLGTEEDISLGITCIQGGKAAADTFIRMQTI